MRALVREGDRVGLVDAPAPRISGERDVLIEVAFAGVCRTDLFVADGSLPVSTPRILGHELSGRVLEVGRGVQTVRPGSAVSVDPRLPCGACGACSDAQSCERPEFLGVHSHGAFAERLCVPESQVLAVPPGLDLLSAAYTEPVAAALAVLGAGIAPEQRGVILGSGRIAELLRQVLRARGFARIELVTPEAAVDLPRDGYDFAVETALNDKLLAALRAAIRPRGSIVIKSRAPRPLRIEPAEYLQKELRLVFAGYGSFNEALELLADGSLDVRALSAAPRPLEAYAEVFAAARAGERHKQFFTLAS